MDRNTVTKYNFKELTRLKSLWIFNGKIKRDEISNLNDKVELHNWIWCYWSYECLWLIKFISSKRIFISILHLLCGIPDHSPFLYRAGPILLNPLFLLYRHQSSLRFFSSRRTFLPAICILCLSAPSSLGKFCHSACFQFLSRQNLSIEMTAKDVLSKNMNLVFPQHSSRASLSRAIEGHCYSYWKFLENWVKLPLYFV